MVSDLEMVSAKTLEAWHYEDKKRQQEAARVQEKAVLEKEKRLYQRSHGKVENSAARLPKVPEVKPHLVTDGAQLSCSRCRSQAIEHRKDVDEYHCLHCGKLEFEGWPTEKTAPYFPAGKDSWML